MDIHYFSRGEISSRSHPLWNILWKQFFDYNILFDVIAALLCNNLSELEFRFYWAWNEKIFIWRWYRISFLLFHVGMFCSIDSYSRYLLIHARDSFVMILSVYLCRNLEVTCRASGLTRFSVLQSASFDETQQLLNDDYLFNKYTFFVHLLYVVMEEFPISHLPLWWVTLISTLYVKAKGLSIGMFGLWGDACPIHTLPVKASDRSSLP